MSTRGRAALADAIGCTQSMISMLVQGKRVPSARLAVQLHAITGVPLKMLLGARRLAPPLKTKKRGPPGWRAAAGQHTSP